MKLKKSVVALFVMTTWASVTVFAQSTTAESESTLTYNVGLVSDYRYRGISQTGRKAALQFGEDYADKSGFYVGNWNSTIEWIKDTADTSTVSNQSAKGPLEMDFYGGYKSSITELIGYDVGLLEYYYPSSNLSGVTNKYNGVSAGFLNASSTEIYGAVSAGAFTLKFSDSITNLFGYIGTKNSRYVDISYSLDLSDGWSSIIHYGNQSMKASNAAQVTSGVTDYNDFSASIAKDFGGVVVSGTVIATDWSKRGSHINDTLFGSGTTNIAGDTVVLGIKKNF